MSTNGGRKRHAAKQVQVLYFSQFREKRGLSGEAVETDAETALDLYRELSERHDLYFNPDAVRVAVNETLSEWDTPVCDGDTVVFLTPFAGGS